MKTETVDCQNENRERLSARMKMKQSQTLANFNHSLGSVFFDITAYTLRAKKMSRKHSNKPE